MAQFKYTLPSGSTFLVDAPNGTTQTQADYVFYTQVAAGALVGYTAGQVLSSPATKLINFELSRQDRDTAGVPGSTILAIVSNSPIVATVPKVRQELINPINAATLATTPVTGPVGPLTPAQVQALLAQLANNPNGGIGDYSLQPAQLEAAGYLKPGTSNYNCTSDHLMSTPSVWTGKNGVYEMTDIVNDPVRQANIATEVMQNNYNSLVAAGVIKDTTNVPPTLAAGQVYTSNSSGTGGLSTVSALTLLTGAAAITGQLNGLVGTISNAFSSGNVVSALSVAPLTQLTTLASGAVNTALAPITSTINASAAAVATANNLIQGSIGTAIGTYNTISSTVTGTVNSLNTAVTTVGSLADKLANTGIISTATAGDVGALVTNASQFGTGITTAWAQNVDLGSITSGAQSLIGGVTGSASDLISGAKDILGGATSTVTGLASDLTGQFSSITSSLPIGDLTNLVQGSLGTLTGGATSAVTNLFGQLNAFGSMASFATAFSMFSGDSLVSSTQPAPGYSNTVNRQTVDAATNRIIGSDKVTQPIFEYPSASALNLGADITQAKNILTGISGTATNLLTQGTNTYNQLAGSTATISKLFG